MKWYQSKIFDFVVIITWIALAALNIWQFTYTPDTTANDLKRAADLHQLEIQKTASENTLKLEASKIECQRDSIYLHHINNRTIIIKKYEKDNYKFVNSSFMPQFDNWTEHTRHHQNTK